MRRSEHHAPPCSVAGTYSTVDELAGMSPARYATPDPDDDGYDEDVPAPAAPAADDDAAPADEPVVGDADGGGGGSMGKARRWAKVLPDPSCCPALPLLLLTLIGTVASVFVLASVRGAAAVWTSHSIDAAAGASTRGAVKDRSSGERQRSSGTDAASAQRQSTSSRAGEAAARASTSTRVRDHVGRMSSSPRLRPSARTQFCRETRKTAGYQVPLQPLFASLICQDKTGTEPALKGLLASLDFSFDYAALPPPTHTYT